MPTFEQLRSIPEPKLTVPGLLPSCEPYPYQIRDAAFLCMQEGCRSLNAEYTGAGKKLVAIMAMLKLFSMGKARNALILTIPDDVDQWEEDFEKFTDGEVRLRKYRGDPKKRRFMREADDHTSVWIASHMTARSDVKDLIGRFDIIVVDESSILKNPETALQPAIAALCAPNKLEQAAYFRWTFNNDKGRWNPNLSDIPGKPADYVWCFTATPYETSPMNVYSGYNVFLGLNSPLGSNPEQFKDKYCEVELLSLKVRGKDGTTFRRTQEKIKGTKPEMLPVFRDAIKPYYARHNWDEVAAHLPKVKVIPHWINLTTAQKKVYKELEHNDTLVADWAAFEQGEGKSRYKEVSAAVRFHYQIRACDGLFGLPGQTRKDSARIAWTREKLNGELADEKVVIFSLFYHNLDFLEEILAKDSIDSLRIDGNPERSDEDNTAARRMFMQPTGPKVLLITTKAIRGLNLQIANQMICINTMTNPAANEQLYGRIARRKSDGSKEPVIAHHPLHRDTVEETLVWPYLETRSHEAKELFGSKYEQNPYGLLLKDLDAVVA